jgi:hypothetical protein
VDELVDVPARSEVTNIAALVTEFSRGTVAERISATIVR